METVRTERTDSHTAKSNSSIRTWLGYAKYCGILLGLLAIGYAGHSTHWSFGLVNHAEPEHLHESHRPPVTTDEKTTSDGWQIEFPSESSLRHSGIKTFPIEQRSICEQVKTTGVVTYNERLSASLSARVSGTVWRVLRQPGDSVQRGDILVIIDAVEVGRAKAEFLSDLVDYESKMNLLQNLETIVGAVSGRQVREARVAVREAKIRLQNTEQTLTNMGFQLRKETFQELGDDERVARIQFLGLPESIVKDLDPAQTTSNLLPVFASFDGVLLHHDAALGEMVEAGKPLLEVADLRRMWLKLDVPKEDAAKLMLGQSVRFAPDGLEQEFSSTITWINTEMNPKTRTLQIRAEVDNPVVSSDPTTGQEVRMLRANTFGTGIITLKKTEVAFVVPLSSVLYSDDQPMVFAKVSDLTFMRIDVTLGTRDAGFVQIESAALKPGLEIVNQGSHVLKSEWILNHVASAQ